MISHFMQNVNNIGNYSQNCALKIYEHYKKILFVKKPKTKNRDKLLDFSFLFKYQRTPVVFRVCFNKFKSVFTHRFYHLVAS